MSHLSICPGRHQENNLGRIVLAVPRSPVVQTLQFNMEAVTAAWMYHEST